MTVTLPSSLLDRLRSELGDEHVITDPDLVRTYLSEPTGRFGGHPGCAVVRPGVSSDVGTVMYLTNRTGVTVVPQGGRTGLVGGGVPTGPGQLILSLERLKGLSWTESGHLQAEAGVTLAELQAFAAERGLWLPLDIGSRDSATVGGMIATNAGGHYTARYGSMGEHFVSLVVVHADGNSYVLPRGSDSGSDQMIMELIGSEGTRAIITEATFRLVPLPVEPFTVLVGAPCVASALSAAKELQALGVMAVELMTQGSLVFSGQAVDRYPHATYLLVEAEESQLEDVYRLILRLQTTSVLHAGERIGDGDRAVRRHWAIRDGIPEACNRHPPVLKLDVWLPASTYAQLYDELESLIADVATESSSPTLVVFGHISGLNYHINIVGLTPTDIAHVKEAILARVIELGGNPSHEHGIGVDKVRHLAGWLGPEETAADQAVTRTWDEQGILRRGVRHPIS